MTIAKEGIFDVCDEGLQSISIQVFGVLQEARTKQEAPSRRLKCCCCSSAFDVLLLLHGLAKFLDILRR